jgi:hypothetical protein
MQTRPSLIQTLFKQVILIIPCLCILSCSEPNPPNPNAIEEIELTSGGTHVTFNMPATYKTQNKVDDLMVFSLKYPSMEALDPDGIPQADEIAVWVELFDRRGSTEQMVAKALPERNPSRPGHEYHAGTEGSYELYRAFVGNGESQVEVTYYVFKAEDGSLVGAEDPGDWSGSYKVSRKIAPNLQIKYLVAKPLGKDFIQIDKAVTAFIIQHRQTNQK